MASVVGRMERLRCSIERKQKELLQDTEKMHETSFENMKSIQARWLELVRYHKELYRAIKANEKTLMIVHTALEMGTEADENRRSMTKADANIEKCDGIYKKLEKRFQDIDVNEGEQESDDVDWPMAEKADKLLQELRDLDYTCPKNRAKGDEILAQTKAYLDRFSRKKFPLGIRREIRGNVMVMAARGIINSPSFKADQ